MLKSKKKLTILLITLLFIIFIFIFWFLNKNGQKNKGLFLEKQNIDFNSLSQEDE